MVFKSEIGLRISSFYGAVIFLAGIAVWASVATFALGDTPKLEFLKPAGLQRGSTATIELNGTFDWPLELDCPGASVKCLEKKGQIEVSVAEDEVLDRVWLRLYNAEGTSKSLPILVDNLPETSEVEPNDDPRKAQQLSEFQKGDSGIEVVINGVLNKNGDVDGFSVNLTKGQTLVAAVAANAYFDSPMDSILQIATLDGTVLSENHDDIGLDPRVAFTAPTDGTYVVRIFAWPSNPNQQIRYHGGKNYIYRLTLTTGPYITHVEPLQVAAGKRLSKVSLHGWNLPTNNQIRPKLLSSNRGLFPELEPHGVLRLSDSAIALVGKGKFAGSARVRVVPPKLSTDSGAETISLDSVLSGTIDSSGTAHAFTLPLKKNQQVVIGVESVSLHSKLVPLVRVENKDGKVLSQTKETGAAQDAKLAFKSPADGEYKLTIRDRFAAGSQRHFYRLTAEEARADFELSVAQESWTLSDAKPLEVAVTVKRHASSPKPIGNIKIKAVDLPVGVTCTEVVSEPKGKTSEKVTLKLESGGTAYSGRIRILGSAARNGEETLERFARTPPRLGACFDRLWLTVLATAKKDDEKKEKAD